MRSLRLLPTLTATILLVAAGCASKPTPPGGPAPTSAGAPNGTAPANAGAPNGTVHLTDYTDNDGPSSTVILAGAIGDFGTAQRLASGKRRLLLLNLSHGSFQLDITGLTARWTALLSDLAVNPTTCSATASLSGPVPIVLSTGTGSYPGITGTFRMTMTLDEVYQPGACAETSPYLAQSIVLTGTGAVAFRHPIAH